MVPIQILRPLAQLWMIDMMLVVPPKKKKKQKQKKHNHAIVGLILSMTVIGAKWMCFVVCLI